MNAPLRLGDVERALIKLEEVGSVERTGEYRAGRPVWVQTEYARELERTNPLALELLLAGHVDQRG